jgi:hypothetical protein
MTMQDILAKVASKELSADDAAKLIGALSPARTAQSVTFKVSRKGAVSVYGLQRMPVTLYAEQWERVLSPEFGKELRAFIAKYAAEDFHGESAEEQGGAKTKYTARIVRK